MYNWIYDLELIRNKDITDATVVSILNIIVLILFFIKRDANITYNFANMFIMMPYIITSILAISIESLFHKRKIKYNIIRGFIFASFIAIVFIGVRYL